MMNQHHLGIIKKLIILVTVLVTVTIYYIFDPAEHSWGPPCLFHATTNWLCWGCGGQRAFHQLLHGHFLTAFQLNVLIYPVLVIMIYIVLSEVLMRAPSYTFFRKKAVAVSAFVMLLGFTILRNI